MSIASNIVNFKYANADRLAQQEIALQTITHVLDVDLHHHDRVVLLVYLCTRKATLRDEIPERITRSSRRTVTRGQAGKMGAASFAFVDRSSQGRTPLSIALSHIVLLGERELFRSEMDDNGYGEAYPSLKVFTISKTCGLTQCLPPANMQASMVGHLVWLKNLAVVAHEYNCNDDRFRVYKNATLSNVPDTPSSTYLSRWNLIRRLQHTRREYGRVPRCWRKR